MPQKWPIKRMIWYGILRKCQHRFVNASPGTLKCSMCVDVCVFHATHIASFQVFFFSTSSYASHTHHHHISHRTAPFSKYMCVKYLYFSYDYYYRYFLQCTQIHTYTHAKKKTWILMKMICDVRRHLWCKLLLKIYYFTQKTVGICM